MKPMLQAMVRDMAVEIPLLLWLGAALLLAGLVVASVGHRPKRSLDPRRDRAAVKAPADPPSPD